MTMTKNDLKEFLQEKFDKLIEGNLCLDKAILIAVLVHGGVRDKGGDPYIRHPLRVMEKQGTEDEQISAVLHDTVEDSELSIDDLRSLGFSEYQLAVIDALTKREGEDYDESIARVKNLSSARKIKISDIHDNLLPWRAKNRHRMGESDMKRIAKYYKALSDLGAK
jgi:(p)ppGpp synthase/HD superfamily hydrolase